MDSAIGPETPKVTATTSGFVLAAAIVVLFNTTLACAKDAYAPLKNFMKSISGHDWTTQGLVDLLLFVALGFLFMNRRVGEKLPPDRLTGVLIGAVAIAGFGLALWYALF
jgi:hypothetical protein